MITYFSHSIRIMSKGKIVIKLSIIIFTIFVIFLAVSPANSKTKGFVKGYIDQARVKDTTKDYTATLIRYFNADPSWNPAEENNTSLQPEITAEAAVLIDMDSGEILFEKNSAKKSKIASLTKVMTAIIALEHKKKGDQILISKRAATIGENSMGISEDESYSLEELLYGLILHSGNDAAYAIAEGTAGDVETFVGWMNIKAKELGLNNTYFADPSGLDDASFSTPIDLVKLTRYALQNPDLREIAKTVEYEIPSSKEHKYIFLQNQTNLLTTYPGVQGFKTGYTEEAGLCLITNALNEGKELVGIVLNSTDRKGDMVLMLDHGYSTLGINIEHELLE